MLSEAASRAVLDHQESRTDTFCAAFCFSNPEDDRAMPWKPKRPCRHPGCGDLADGRYCERHAVDAERARRKESDSKRGSPIDRGYGYAWQKARAAFLRKHPLCLPCQKRGRVAEAHVVDHIAPHRGDMKLFWDSKNWQSLCANCHNSYKQRLEKSGRASLGCTPEGYPIEG